MGVALAGLGVVVAAAGVAEAGVAVAAAVVVAVPLAAGTSKAETACGVRAAPNARKANTPRAARPPATAIASRGFVTGELVSYQEPPLDNTPFGVPRTR